MSKSKQHFESAKEIMDNLRAVKGPGYARTVESALIALKLRDLFEFCATKLEEDDADKLSQASGQMLAMLTSLCAVNGGIASSEKGIATELMGWAEKIYAAEQDGAEAFLRGE
jgi:hypothetical protein